jgi:hypothetical protein
MSAAERNRHRATGWAIAVVGSVILWAIIGATAWSATAAFAGSDSQTPYTVTAEGVTLPAGTTFSDGGHVNWRTNRGSYGIHFESLNNQPSGVYIGQSFLPFNLAPGECVVWVQVWLYEEHYGGALIPPQVWCVRELMDGPQIGQSCPCAHVHTRTGRFGHPFGGWVAD